MSDSKAETGESVLDQEQVVAPQEPEDHNEPEPEPVHTTAPDETPDSNLTTDLQPIAAGEVTVTIASEDPKPIAKEDSKLEEWQSDLLGDLAAAGHHATSSPASSTHRQSGVKKQARDELAAHQVELAVQSRTAAISEAFSVVDLDNGGSIDINELKVIFGVVGIEPDDEELTTLAQSMNATQSPEGLEIFKDDFVAAFLEFIDSKEDVCDIDFTPPSDANTALKWELYLSIQNGEITNLMNAWTMVDEDGGGSIDADEFKAAMRALRITLSDQKLDELFAEMDDDGSGDIDREEFMTFVADNNALFNVNLLGGMDGLFTEQEVTAEEQDEAAAKLSMLEQLGMKYTNNRTQRHADKHDTSHATAIELVTSNGEAPPPVVAEKKSVAVTAEQRKLLSTTENTAMYLDIFAGFLSGMLGAIFEVIAADEWGQDASEDWFSARFWYYWSVVGGSAIVLTVFEIVFIYWVHMRAVVRMSRNANLMLWPVTKKRAFVIGALTRCALELPHPNTKHEKTGIDPLERASKWRILIAGLLYKAKTGLTTFIMRVVVKKVALRGVVKGGAASGPDWTAFVAVPVNMFWDGLVGYKCIRAARVVALGPALVISIVDGLFQDRIDRGYRKLNRPVKECALRAIAVVVVNQEQMHPNMEAMVDYCRIRLTNNRKITPSPGSEQLFRELLHSDKLTDYDRLFIMRIYSFAACLDGYVEQRLLKVWRNTSVECGLLPESMSYWPLRVMCETFIKGAMTLDILLDLYTEESLSQIQNSGCHKVTYACQRAANCCAC